MIKEIYKKIFSERQRLYFRTGLYKFRALPLYGKKYYCNCCNRRFKKFLTKGHNPRLNAECPYCGSLERTRLLLLYFQNHPQLLSGNISLLHFAPEHCLYPFFTAHKNINYMDVDLNPNLASHQMDITDIPMNDNHFDMIICSHVLGHVPDEAKAIQEMYRVLKPGGWAFILTLLDRNRMVTYENPAVKTSAEKLRSYGESDLVRLHGKDFHKRIEKEGFIVEVIDYALQLEPQQREIFNTGNGDREIIFKCTK